MQIPPEPAYLAEDTRLGRKVAIKVLAEEYASDPERLARFEHVPVDEIAFIESEAFDAHVYHHVYQGQKKGWRLDP